jgi:hypothetical protein
MLPRLSIAFLVAVTAFVLGTPLPARADSPTNSKIRALLKQLKKLPNAGAPTSKVIRLTKQLAKLKPVKAQQYYKIAIQKFQPAVAQTQADKLAKTVIKIVQNADLPAGKINSLTRQIKKIDRKFVPPSPTPTPYQALQWMAPSVASV